MVLYHGAPSNRAYMLWGMYHLLSTHAVRGSINILVYHVMVVYHGGSISIP